MAQILLIDDDDTFRETLSLALVGFGHAVIEARNGKEGLKILSQANPDLLITDIVMPEMEGLELVMKTRGVRPQMKIIAISGGGQKGSLDYLQAARLMGATKIIPKPFHPDVISAAIEELLPNATR
jgi:CheY-like chemotaxis protein